MRRELTGRVMVLLYTQSRPLSIPLCLSSLGILYRRVADSGLTHPGQACFTARDDASLPPEDNFSFPPKTFSRARSIVPCFSGTLLCREILYRAGVYHYFSRCAIVVFFGGVARELFLVRGVFPLIIRSLWGLLYQCSGVHLNFF